MFFAFGGQQKYRALQREERLLQTVTHIVSPPSGNVSNVQPGTIMIILITITARQAQLYALITEFITPPLPSLLLLYCCSHEKRKCWCFCKYVFGQDRTKQSAGRVVLHRASWPLPPNRVQMKIYLFTSCKERGQSEYIAAGRSYHLKASAKLSRDVQQPQVNHYYIVLQVTHF